MFASFHITFSVRRYVFVQQPEYYHLYHVTTAEFGVKTIKVMCFAYYN